MSKNYAQIAERYAKDVLSGEIDACVYVKLACQRQLDDLSRKDLPYSYNPELIDKQGRKYKPGDRVCTFLEMLHHVKGKWMGSSFILEPWQVFIVHVGFGWVDGAGNRRFREIYLEVPRKNGKSFISAGLGLYMFLADGEPGAEIFVGANGEEQANKVFAPAWLMVNQNVDLKNHYNVKVYGNTPDTGRLGTDTDYSKMQRLIGNPKDGDMPSCYLCDEFHEHADPFQYDTMTTGMGSREKPMTIVTTTAGISKDGPCYEKRAQCINILKGTYENDSIFAVIYTVDKGDDWKDLEVWKKANPNYGISFFKKYIDGKLKEAQQAISKQSIIKCKNLNIWLDSYDSWLDMDYWRACKDTSIKESDFINNYPCYEGADMSATKDLTARVKVYTKDGKYYVFSKFYLPEKVANDQSKTHYMQWTNNGFIETNPGRTIDFMAVGDQIYEDIITNKMFKEFAIDRGFVAWPMIQRLENKLGKTKGKKEIDRMIIEYGKTVKNFSGPMKELEKAIIDGTIIHDGNPVLSWCMGNITVRYDKKDNIFPVKSHVNNKIDGGDALITAFARAMMEDDTEDSGNDGSLL